ncbi:MAG: T9SS type A sorting domain-containing protein [Salibacteraceae bacterium]
MKNFHNTVYLIFPTLFIGFCAILLTPKQHFDGSMVLKDQKQQDLAEWERLRLMDPDLGTIPVGISQKEKLFSQTLPKDKDAASRTSGIVYEPRGPYNVGGRTRSVEYDVSNLQNILAAGINGGIWKSTNNGGTWKQVSDPDQTHNASALTQDTRSGKEQIWYCGTGEGGYPSAGHHGSAYLKGEGVYKSTDGGETWNVLPSTVPDNHNGYFDWSTVWNMATDPSNTTQDEVYAAANGVIMRSVDGGNTWVKELGSTNGAGYAWVGVTTTGVVYAAIGNSGGNTTDFGIWRSTDGMSWNKIGDGVIPSNSERIIFDIAPSNENVIFFLMRTPGVGSISEPGATTNEWSSLYRFEYLSGNGTGSGATWKNLSANIPSHGNAYYTFDTQGGYCMSIKVKPNNFNIVFIGGTNLFRSIDAFNSSNNITQIGGYNPKSFTDPTEYRYPNQHPDQHYITFRGSNSNEMISSTDGGVHYTRDAQASEVVWVSKNNGYTTTQFYTVAIDLLTENDVILGGTQDNGTQFTNNASFQTPWTDPLKSDGSYCAVQGGGTPTGGGIYYMSTQYGSTYKIQMNSDGTKGNYRRIDYPGSSDNYDFINPFHLDYNNPNLMVMAYVNQTGQQILKRNLSLTNLSLNNSNAPSTVGWSDISGTFNGRISALKSTRSNPKDRIYVGTSSGNVYKVENASTSATLTSISSGSDFPYKRGTYVSDISVHPEDGNKIMLSFSNYNVYSIYYSEDGGATWEGVAGNLEDTIPPNWPDQARGQGNGPSVRSVAIIPTDDGITYMAATSTGLYATYELDGINTVWVEQGSDVIGNTVVEKLEVRNSDNYLGIATHGKGIYSSYIYTSDPTLFTKEDLNKHQNALKAFPNPAQENTTLLVEGTENEILNLVIYNNLGKVIYSRNLGQSKNGKNEFQIDLNEFDTGIYYANVTGSNFDKTIKLIKN